MVSTTQNNTKNTKILPRTNGSMHEITPQLYLGSVHAAENKDLLKAYGITHILSLTSYKLSSAATQVPIQDLFRQMAAKARGETPQPQNQDKIGLYPEDFDYLVYDKLTDNPDTNLKEHFEVCHDFIGQALNDDSKKVLVHCMMGVSRSATILISYLMRDQKMSLDDALTFVKSKRSAVKPNDGFMGQLREYEQELFK